MLASQDRNGSSCWGRRLEDRSFPPHRTGRLLSASTASCKSRPRSVAHGGRVIAPPLDSLQPGYSTLCSRA